MLLDKRRDEEQIGWFKMQTYRSEAAGIDILSQ
jgi:hypothetical protein